jgi:hypothetical protein
MQQVSELGIIQPHPGQRVGDPVAQEVDLAPAEVAIEIAEQPRDERHEGLPVVIGAHRGELIQPDAGRGMAEYVGALERTAHPPLRDHREHAGVDETGHVAVQARRGDVLELVPERRGRKRAVAEKGLHDPQPDRVQQQINARHLAHASGPISMLLTFSLMIMMPAALIPVAVVEAAFVIFCLVDLARAPEVRYLPRWAWAIICLICNPFGGLAYLIFGRNR